MFNNQSERLGESIYCSSWFDGSPELRTTVLFVIQRSQKPLEISIPGILPALTLKFYASVSFAEEKRSSCLIYGSILVFFLFITACIIDFIVPYDSSCDIWRMKVCNTLYNSSLRYTVSFMKRSISTFFRIRDVTPMETKYIWGKIRQVYQVKKFDVTDFLEILQECCMNIKQQKCKRIFRYHHLLLRYRAANFAI